MTTFLPSLVAVCRAARMTASGGASASAETVAVASGTSVATLYRFENDYRFGPNAGTWPDRVDEIVAGYATVAKVEPLTLWAAALKHARRAPGP